MARDNKLPRAGPDGRLAPDIRRRAAREAWAMRQIGARMIDIEAHFGIGEETCRQLVKLGRAIEEED